MLERGSVSHGTAFRGRNKSLRPLPISTLDRLALQQSSGNS
jgi:hypothetical protein